MDDPPETADAAPIPIVTLANEIDSVNCDQAAADLALALGPDVRVVIANLSHTTFCDSSGIRVLLHAHNLAASRGIELRLVVNSEGVLRVMQLTGLTSTFRLFPNIDAALRDGLDRT